MWLFWSWTMSISLKLQVKGLTQAERLYLNAKTCPHNFISHIIKHLSSQLWSIVSIEFNILERYMHFTEEEEEETNLVFVQTKKNPILNSNLYWLSTELVANKFYF